MLEALQRRSSDVWEAYRDQLATHRRAHPAAFGCAQRRRAGGGVRGRRALKSRSRRQPIQIPRPRVDSSASRSAAKRSGSSCGRWASQSPKAMATTRPPTRAAKRRRRRRATATPANANGAHGPASARPRSRPSRTVISDADPCRSSHRVRQVGGQCPAKTDRAHAGEGEQRRRRPGQGRSPGDGCARREEHDGHPLGVTHEQRRDRLVVGHPPAVPHDRPDAILVGDDDLRLVADLPPGVVQAPHQIDVLAEHEPLVEPGAERVASREHGGAGHVPDGAIGTHKRGTRTHVEGGARALVGGDRAALALGGADTRSDQRHRRIAQVIEQPAGKPRRRDAIGVEETHEWRACHAQTRVPCRGRALVLAMPYVPCADLLGDRGDRPRIG